MLHKRPTKLFYVYEKIEGERWELKWVQEAVVPLDACEFWLGNFFEEYRKRETGKSRPFKKIGICDTSFDRQIGQIFSSSNIEKDFVFIYEGW